MKKIIAVCVLLVCLAIVLILLMDKDNKISLKKMSLELKPGVNIEFVECPAGSFIMGYSEEDNHPHKKHKVTITRPFWMATTKLTIEQLLDSGHITEYEKGLYRTKKYINPEQGIVLEPKIPVTTKATKEIAQAFDEIARDL